MKTILKGISILILTTYMLGCSNKKIDLNSEEKIMLVADPNKLGRVFNNFIKNGYKGCPVVLAIWYND